jgi:hypothetical protein
VFSDGLDRPKKPPGRRQLGRVPKYTSFYHTHQKLS